MPLGLFTLMEIKEQMLVKCREMAIKTRAESGGLDGGEPLPPNRWPPTPGSLQAARSRFLQILLCCSPGSSRVHYTHISSAWFL